MLPHEMTRIPMPNILLILVLPPRRRGSIPASADRPTLRIHIPQTRNSAVVGEEGGRRKTGLRFLRQAVEA